MKKQILKAAIAGSVIAALGFGATAANAAAASAAARARILRQVSVTNTSDLQFGTIVSGTAASTVVLTPAGGLTCGTGLICSGTATAAGFNVAGTTGQVVTVSVPASVVLTATSGSMTASLSRSVAALTLANSAGSFSVGGTLNVGANQADGDYLGSFDATVDYQ